MKKGILLAVCLLLVGMLSVNGTYALAAGEALDGIFQWLSEAFFPKEFVEPRYDSTRVQVENVYQVRGENGLVSGQADYLVPAALNPNAEVKIETVSLNGHSYSLWTKEYAPWAADKFVSVRNDGSDPVYFRTAIAIQYDPQLWQALHVNVNTTDFVWATSDTATADELDKAKGKRISIDGRDYVMLVATYTGALAKNETSPAMIMQLALNDVNITSAQLQNALDMRVTTVAVGVNGFVTKDANGNTVPMGPMEALRHAVPLDTFNPFSN